MRRKARKDLIPIGAELLVIDFKLAREFYVDQLGLTIIKENLNRSVTISNGKMMLCIDLGTYEESELGGGATVFFKVKDVSSTARMLRQ